MKSFHKEIQFVIAKNYSKASEAVDLGNVTSAQSHYALANSQVQLASISTRSHLQLQIDDNTPPSSPDASQGLSDDEKKIIRKVTSVQPGIRFCTRLIHCVAA